MLDTLFYTLLTLAITDLIFNFISHNINVHVLCLRREDTILVIVCTGLSINTTVIHEWINNLILQMYYS